MNKAFFALHSDLPREGPGEPFDVDWAMDLLDLPETARICDAGSGPGADIPPLLAHIPNGHLLAVDTHAPFIEVIQKAFSDDDRVTARVQDMATLQGPFDLIWSAGALYFLGGAAGLSKIKPALAPSGAIVFSEPCFFVESPSDAARAFWEGEDANVLTPKEILAHVADAGFEVLGHRKLADSAWEAYYAPMEARMDDLAGASEPDLLQVLSEARREIDGWRACRHETGYLQIAARCT